MKKVSIIIPTYKNRGGLIVSIGSALRQSYPKIEVIVVDDNSPDSLERKNTRQIMEAYSNDSRVIYLQHTENRNGAAARNTGINFSNGDYIAFLDDDDEFLETKIELQVKYLESHNEYDAVYCYSFVNDKKEEIHPYEGDASILLLMCKTKMFTPSLMFRREPVIEIGGFDESFRRHQDYELLLKFFSHGYKIGCLREYLTKVHSLGGNKPTPERMIDIKKQYLTAFEDVISKQEENKPGIRKEILAANYETIFESCLSQRRFKLALVLFVKYFFVSPSSFTRNFVHSNYMRFKRKI